MVTDETMSRFTFLSDFEKHEEEKDCAIKPKSRVSLDFRISRSKFTQIVSGKISESQYVHSYGCC